MSAAPEDARRSPGSLDKMPAAPEDARPAPGTPVRPSPGTTVVTPTKVGPDEWRRDGVGGHTPEVFDSRAAELKGAPTQRPAAGVGVVGLTHELDQRDAESFYVQVADLKGDAHAERTRREREERRLSMEREFREILPHTSIGKRRAGWEAPVYWKDKDPKAPPPDASGGSDAAALCAAATSTLCRRRGEQHLRCGRGARAQSKDESEASVESLAPPLTTSRGTRDGPGANS